MTPIFEDLPLPLDPVYRTPDVNAPVELFNGAVDIIRGQTTATGKTGNVALVWLPSPRIRLRVIDFSDSNLLRDKDWEVAIPKYPKRLSVLWTNQTPAGGAGAKGPCSSGILNDDDTFSGYRLSCVLFHLANGPAYLGSAVRNSTGTGFQRRRVTLDAHPWRVVIDALPQWSGSDARESLKASGGCAITHVGRLERIDEASFDGKEADAPLAALGWLLAFTRGAWTGPMLLAGEDASTKEHRHIWRCPRVDPQFGLVSWFNELSCEGFRIFPNLCARLADATWGNSVRNAMGWYIVANKPGVVMVEGAIVLQQAAFELLAWTLLVEDRKILSVDGMEKLSASDAARLMLSTCGIPLQIPGELCALARLAKELNWTTGPQATTEIRNAVVHGSRKKRERVLGKGTDACIDAWLLGQWYLELVLLHLFGYRGKYSNRLRGDTSRGNEVEPVPWANP